MTRVQPSARPPRATGGTRRGPGRRLQPTRCQHKLTRVDPVILASARKHGIADDDMLHAYRNPIRVFALDDLTMLIGADESARTLEVGIATAEGVEFIVHAMAARKMFLR